MQNAFSSSYLKEAELKGKFEATVIDNKDPLNSGRILVKCPKIMDDVDFWARPCVPFAGKKSGFYFIPEVKSRVWIEFAGYLDDPIWTGSMWLEGDGNELPTSNRETKPQEKIIQSTSGMRLVFDDEKEQITISGQDDDNQIIIEVLEGKITIKGGSKVVIDARNIELGLGANQPVVKGNELLNFLIQLNSVVSGKSPFSPPLPLPNILSAVVKTK